VIFFTADLHLGHKNIIKHCDRPFSSVNEMDEHLITAWNSHVQPDDSVYIIGDFIFRSTISPTNYLSRLNGKKHLLLGNHDTNWIKKVDLTKYFATVDRFLEISDGQHYITLCHYPLMSWNRMSKGGYMIHGHIHNNRNAFYFPMLKQMPNLLNAGVDINGFSPVTLDELVKNNEIFKYECP
jgi:calcineurin-like phosphoesterase family protein